ncbi:hypothetical protein [Paenibacillus mesotrionivorans]|uniref:Uncharacterized protein n=1 Tax=Paenibacillus mesotrionivorans TaxID=3160968 RepID=A0ACC7NTE9_9BACL
MGKLRWELKERYDAQALRFVEITDKYEKAVIDAGTRLQDLKAELDAIVRTEIQTGADKGAEKTKMRARITEAEADVAQAQVERERAADYVRAESEKDRVTIRDLVVDWNGPYLKAVREAELYPIVKRMAAARDAYYSAVLEYYQLVEDYRLQRHEIAILEYDDKRPGDGIAVHEIANIHSLPLVTYEDFRHIEQFKKLPEVK